MGSMKAWQGPVTIREADTQSVNMEQRDICCHWYCFVFGLFAGQDVAGKENDWMGKLVLDGKRKTLPIASGFLILLSESTSQPGSGKIVIQKVVSHQVGEKSAREAHEHSS